MSGHANVDPAFLNNAPSVASTAAVSSASLSTSTSTASSAAATTAIVNAAASSASSSAQPSSSLESIYFYEPSTAGAIAFSVLYLIHIVYHFYLSIYIPHIRKSVANKHKYTIPLFIAAVLSTFGFSVRIASVSSESGRASVGLFASSTCFVIVAPIFVCATLYLMVVHLIRLCLPSGPEQTFLGISPRWLGRVFITSDVLSFLMQSAGSAIAASANWEGESKSVGENVLIAGLAAQLATFTVYMVVLLLFCLRVSAGKSGNFVDGEGSEGARKYGFNPLVKQVVRGMWIASAFVEVNCPNLIYAPRFHTTRAC